MSTYPVFLTRLDEHRSVVVGTGPAAERKVNGLLDAGANITLIDPSPPHPFTEWVETDAINWIDRSYRSGDLEGAALVIVTEADPSTTTQVWEEAQARNVLINTTGDNAHSTFANGSSIRRGPLVVSVSTSGAAPTVSVRLRQHLEDTFGPEYEVLLNIMNTLREPMKTHVSSFEDRRDRWYALVDSDVLSLIRDEKEEEAWSRIESIVGPEVVDHMEASSDTWGSFT